MGYLQSICALRISVERREKIWVNVRFVFCYSCALKKGQKQCIQMPYLRFPSQFGGLFSVSCARCTDRIFCNVLICQMRRFDGHICRSEGCMCRSAHSAIYYAFVNVPFVIRFKLQKTYLSSSHFLLFCDCSFSTPKGWMIFMS